MGVTQSSFIPVGVDVGLRDGGTVHVRPVLPTDDEALRVFFAGLSDESRYFRFFSGGVNLAGAARALTRAGGGLGLVATTGVDREVVGHGVYLREPGQGDRAEVAFAIAGDWQGHDLATTLLVELAQAAVAGASRSSRPWCCRPIIGWSTCFATLASPWRSALRQGSCT